MQAANFIFKSIATSTRQSYSTGERQFIRFCLGHRLVSPGYPLVACPRNNFDSFCNTLSSSVSHGTIRVYLAAVKNFMLSLAIPWISPLCRSFTRRFAELRRPSVLLSEPAFPLQSLSYIVFMTN